MSDSGMLEETGRVVSIEGDYVLIETKQRSACEQCETQNGCATSVLSELFKNRRNLIRLENNLGLVENDQVVLGIDQHRLIVAAFKAYLMPVALMAIFGVFASNMSESDLFCLVFSVLGLLLGLGISGRQASVKNDDSSGDIVLLRKHNHLNVEIY